MFFSSLVFGFSYLFCLQLYLRTGNFHLPWPLPEALPIAFFITACAVEVAGAFLLPISLLLLASLLGHQDGECLCYCQVCRDHRHHYYGRSRVLQGALVTGTSTRPRVVSFQLATATERDGGSQTPLWLEVSESCYCCSVPCGCGWNYNLEAWVMWATSAAATRVSGAVASAATTVRPVLQALSPLFPQFFLLCVF